MSYVVLVIVVVVLTVTPFTGLIPLDEREQNIIDNYKGFVDISIDTTESIKDDLVGSSDVSGLCGGIGSNAEDVSNMQILGDLSPSDLNDSSDDVKVDIQRYL